MTKDQYLKITRPFREHPELARSLHILNKILEIFMVAAYVLLLIYEFREKEEALVRSILVPLDAYIITSVFRWLVGRKRPYEVFGVEPVIHKESKGNSFPSRHVFSAFVIAMTYLLSSPWFYAGIGLLAAAAVIAVVRVLSGVHYVSDVVCGAMIGIGAGVIGFLIL